MNKKWIRQAIPEEHRGKLEKWAKEHHFMYVDGTINLREALTYAKKHGETKRIKEINLAKTLKSFHKKKGE